MRHCNILLAIGMVLTCALFSGCGHKAAALKEGIIWNVRWSVSDGTGSTRTYGFYRTDKVDPRFGGDYTQDMYGILYPTCLEVRFIGSHDDHAQIIPLNQIVWLEFGDGGIRR
jgi:hypothetical protein